MVGQQMFYLGFPFGWSSGHERLNRDFPIPIVKSGIASTLHQGDPSVFFIGSQGNKGFSGGPVVFNGRKINQALIFVLLALSRVILYR